MHTREGPVRNTDPTYTCMHKARETNKHTNAPLPRWVVRRLLLPARHPRHGARARAPHLPPLARPAAWRGRRAARDQAVGRDLVRTETEHVNTHTQTQTAEFFKERVARQEALRDMRVAMERSRALAPKPPSVIRCSCHAYGRMHAWLNDDDNNDNNKLTLSSLPPQPPTRHRRRRTTRPLLSGARPGRGRRCGRSTAGRRRPSPGGSAPSTTGACDGWLGIR